jgi:tetratricopeptide (TPR) repeat protein
MKIVARCATALLLVLLASPQVVRGDGDRGKAYEIGEKYYATKDYAAALKHYRRALEQHEMRAHYRLGLIFEATGRDRDALRHYRLFQELAQPEAERSDVAQRVSAIEERMKQRPPQKPPRQLARKPAQKPAQQHAQHPARPAGLLEQGKALLKSGKYREAQQVLLQAVARDQSRPEPHFLLGEAYLGLEDYGRAEEEYRAAAGRY